MCRGRQALRWQVTAGLLYGQVKKHYRRCRLVLVTPVMRHGTQADLKDALMGLGLSGRLNTAFIERVNLTMRHGVAALARRTWATSQLEMIRKNGDSKVGDYTLDDWAACSKASGLRYCNVECKRTGL